MSLVINGKTINAILDPDDDRYKFPVLYSTSKLGKELWWSISTLDHQVIVSKGQTGGKTTDYNPSSCAGKNIGKKNETTPEQQALLEAQSKWTKKTEAGYHPKQEENDEDEEENESDVEEKMPTFTRVLPMLANKFDLKKKIKYPAYVSRKLDGIRCLSAMVKNGENTKIEMWSRTTKPFKFFEEIRNNLEEIFKEFKQRYGQTIILDGELYSHDVPFNELSGIVRQITKPSAHESKIIYHVFDIVDVNMSYESRLRMLMEINEFVEENEIDNIKIVGSDVVNNADEIQQFHDDYVKEGYEGIMIRAFEGKYVIKSRTNNLLKYKMFEDTEFEVVGVLKAKGTEEGGVVFTCKENGGDRTFNVRPRGSIAKRRWQYENKENYIGKMLTVRWQAAAISGGELPRFGTGIKFDKEVEKMEPVDFRDYE